jgi:hypothetical protein
MSPLATPPSPTMTPRFDLVWVDFVLPARAPRAAA